MSESKAARPRKPIETRLRFGRLSSVLSARHNKLLHQHIARLCVLFEDLRIEIAGLAADDLARLDETSKNGRYLYFLRRSMGTLYEFTEALEEIDAAPEFDEVRVKMGSLVLPLWTRAIAYFRKHKNMIARVRHHVGGHFGSQAARHAIENLVPDASGYLEVAIYSHRGGGAKLGFASELAATALVKNLKGHDTPEKIRRLIRVAVVGYRHAVRAVDCITVAYLWDRFGR